MPIVLVYALRFEDDVVYVGLTKDLSRRLDEHRRRQSPSTKRFKGECEVIYQKACEGYGEARKHEKYLKSGYGHKMLKTIASEGSPRETR
jgi:predicted GIY-YIG superfamily endonuclease